MALIDIDALRAYLLDYCGTAVFSGFPAALLDVADIERMSGGGTVPQGRGTGNRPAAVRRGLTGSLIREEVIVGTIDVNVDYPKPAKMHLIRKR